MVVFRNAELDRFNHIELGIKFCSTRQPEMKHGWDSNFDEGQQVNYADHSVERIAPGLAVDIMPMNVMSAKLCINYLSKGRFLEEALNDSYYIYLNRRENLEPLGLNADNGKQHILSWQGIDLKRKKACPVCGDNFIDEMSKACGVSVSLEDIEKYKLKTEG